DARNGGRSYSSLPLTLIGEVTAALHDKTEVDQQRHEELVGRLEELNSALVQLLQPRPQGETPTLPLVESRRTNLPDRLPSFVGRKVEIAELRTLLQTKPVSRMVTLVGAGGTGKTRLALELAAGIVEEYADGVWLVELADLRDQGLLAQTVAMVMDIDEEA